MGSIYDMRNDHISNTRERCHKDGSVGVTDFWMYAPPYRESDVTTIICGICKEPIVDTRYCNRCTPWKNENLQPFDPRHVPEVHIKGGYQEYEIQDMEEHGLL